MTNKNRASLFCYYKSGPAILSKSGAAPIVQKGHRCVYKISTTESSNESFRNSYLTKCGRFLIITQEWPFRTVKAKVLIIGQCNIQSTTTLSPILEIKIDITADAMHVSPNEKYMVIYEKPTLTKRSLIVNLFEVTLSGPKPAFKKVDSMTLSCTWLHNVSLTDKELIIPFDHCCVRVYNIDGKFSLAIEQSLV